MGSQNGMPCEALIDQSSEPASSPGKNIVAHEICNSVRDESKSFTIGQLVQVDRRAWPGINQPGGIGRIVEISRNHDDTTNGFVSVRYVLDGRYERTIDPQYVHIHNQSSVRSLRDRRMLLGRCQVCGSLRRDCGSCDVWITHQNEEQRGHCNGSLQGRRSALASSRRLPSHPADSELARTCDEDLLGTSFLRNHEALTDKDFEGDDADSIDVMLDEINAFNPKGRKLRSLQRKAKLLLFGGTRDSVHDRQVSNANDASGQEHWKLNSSGKSESMPTDFTSRNHEDDLIPAAFPVPTNLDPNGDNASLSSDEDSSFLQELLCTQTQLLSSPKAALGVEYQGIHTKKRRTAVNRHHSSILESIGSSQCPRFEEEQSSEEDSECPDVRSINASSDSLTKSPLPRVSVPTPSSVLSFASLDTEASDENSGHTEQRSNGVSNDPYMVELVHSQVLDSPQNFDLLSAKQTRSDDGDDALDGCDFIQPEGSAEEMPRDILDQTKNIPFQDLPIFFDRIARYLQSTEIPKARQQLADMEKLIKGCSTAEAAMQCFDRAEETYQQLLIVLVNQGRDQCRNALRKMTSRKKFRRKKESMTSKQQAQFCGTKLEAREMHFEQLDRDLESILMKCRHIMRSLEDEAQRLSEMEEDEQQFQSQRGLDSSQRGHDDDRSYGAFHQAESPPRGTSDDRTLSSFDAHQYAQVKKAKRSIILAEANDSIKRKRATWTGWGKRKRQHSIRYRLDQIVLRKKSSSKSARPRALETGGKVGGNGGGPNNNNIHQAPNDEAPYNEAPHSSLSPSGSEARRQIFFVDQGLPNDVAESYKHGLETGSTLMTTTTKEQRFVLSRRHPHHEQSASSLLVSQQHGPWTYDDIEKSRPQPSASSTMQGTPRTNSDCSQLPEKENTEPFRKRKHTDKEQRSFHRGNQLSAFPPVEADIIDPSEMLIPRESDGLKHRVNPRAVQSQPVHPDGLEALWPNFLTSYPKASITCTQDWDLDLLTDLVDLKCVRTCTDFIRVRQTLARAIRSQKGKRVLQELIARGDVAEFGAHVKLLSASLTLMSLKSEIWQKDDNSSDIFSAPSSTLFFDFVVIQFVEAALSFHMPSAWGLTAPACAQIMKHLESLLHTLSLRVNMIERTSRCILQELQTQQWRISSDEDCVFLSCVDPSLWSKVLDCSETLQSKTGTAPARYASLGQNLPQCEIDAIWCTLAFVASSGQTILENGVWTWKLLADILLRGPLLISDQSLSPSPAQLQECRAAMKHLTDIVPSLQSVGLKDSFLINVVRRASIIGSTFLEQRSLISGFAERERHNGFSVLASRIKGLLVLDENFANRLDALEQNQSLAQSLAQSPEDLLFEERLLLPTSDVARQCMVLVCAWIDCLPAKKVRIKTYIKKSQVSWMEEMEKLIYDNSVSNPQLDPFQKAFTYQQQIEIETKDAQNAYFLEFAAFFKVLSSVCLAKRADIALFVPKLDAAEIAKGIWEVVADSAMEQRFVMVTSMSESPCAFQGNITRVQVCSKVMTFLVLCIVGLNPFKPSNHLKTEESAFFNLAHGRALEFLSGTLLTCLDLSSSWHGSLEPLCFVLSCLGTLVSSLKHLTSSEKSDGMHVSNASTFLRSCWDKFLPVFSRSSRLSEQENTDPLSEHALSLLLSLLYGLMPSLLHQTAAAITSSLPNVEETPTDSTFDDAWGFGLDDSALAGLVDCCEDQNKRNKLYSVSKMLLDALDEAKPSTRYGISTDIAFTQQARIAVAKKLSLVCGCLAKATICSRDEAVADLSFGLLSFSRVWTRTGQDKIYFQRCCHSYLVQLLRIAQSYSCMHLRKYMEDIVLGVLSMSLETKLLRLLPSLTVALTSVVDSQKESTYAEYFRLKEFRKTGKLSALLKRSDTYQEICKGLSRWMGECVDGELCPYPVALDKLDFDLKNKQIEVHPSMEGQLFNRLRLLRGVISSVGSSGDARAFGKLAILLTASAWEMLGLVNSIDKLTTTSSRRLREAIFCFAEFHSAFVAWFLLEATDSNVASAIFRKNIHDHHLNPLLRCSSSCPIPVLEDLAIKKLESGPVEVRPAVLTTVTKNLSNATFVDLPRRMVGRCRELILCIAIDYSRGELHQSSNSSFQSLLDLCHNDDVARAIARCLGRCSEESITIPAQSSFSRSVEGYLTLLGKEKGYQKRYGKAVAKLERYTFEGVLLPRLSRPRLKGSERLAPLRLLRHMLEAVDSDRNNDPLETGIFDLTLFCSLFKCLSTTICCILTEPKVAGDSLLTSLLCLKKCICLPSRKVESTGNGWILDWCYSMCQRHSDESRDKDAHFAYIILTARYFRRISKLLLYKEPGALKDYRAAKRQESLVISSRFFGYWADLELELSNLEQQLGMGTTTASAAYMTNLYSKGKDNGNVAMEEFVPSKETTRIAQMVVLEVERAFPEE